MTWLLLIWLLDAPRPQYAGHFPTQAACMKQGIQIRALDPEVANATCVRWNDPTPSNIG